MMQSRTLARVVWEEGMHLSQHHFQAQSRFFEDASSFALSTLKFGAWGFSGLELDAEALLNGTVSVTHARGIMPDGMAFHFPHDPPPPPLQIRERFSPTQSSHIVHLAIPAFRPGAANAAPPGTDVTSGFRFVPERVECVDEVSGEERNPVFVARKNVRLLLDDELSGDEDAAHLVTLAMARVQRDGRGNFVFDPDFIPPALSVGAVPALSSLLDRMVDLLASRADSIQSERRARGGGTPGPAEVAEMWLAHSVHQALAVLSHMRATRGAHPEAFFGELARLAGALCTFSIETRPEDLPLYDHNELGSCFGELERRVRAGLEVALPTGSFRIPVSSTDHTFHAAPVTDPEAIRRGEIYLGIRSSAPAGNVIDTVPRLVKVCSSQHIRRLVREAFPGLPLQHLPSPPASLRPRPGSHYFHVSKTGPCWASIQDTSEIGIYIPEALPGAEIEIVVATDG